MMMSVVGVYIVYGCVVARREDDSDDETLFLRDRERERVPWFVVDNC